jgi:hypothetical protein
VEIRDIDSNPHPIDSRAWYAVQDQLFEMFMARVPENRVRLREMVAADGGPELDLSVGSLAALGEWFVDWARRDPDDGEDWSSVRVRHTMPPGSVTMIGTKWISAQYERMQDRVAVYLGDVAMGLVPGSRWVCWRAGSVGDRFAGEVVVDVGDPDVPFRAPGSVGWVCGSAYARSFDPSKSFYRPPEPHAWAQIVTSTLERLEKRRERGLEPEFQPAPTGPEAKGRKRPHSGRLTYEIQRRLDN